MAILAENYSGKLNIDGRSFPPDMQKPLNIEFSSFVEKMLLISWGSLENPQVVLCPASIPICDQHHLEWMITPNGGRFPALSILLNSQMGFAVFCPAAALHPCLGCLLKMQKSLGRTWAREKGEEGRLPTVKNRREQGLKTLRSVSGAQITRTIRREDHQTESKRQI